jgi:hypothetical protein
VAIGDKVGGLGVFGRKENGDGESGGVRCKGKNEGEEGKVT